jgi:tetratricopeptide (TPR) repeat protein
VFERPSRTASSTPGGNRALGGVETSALFLLATLAVVWGWWAWREGAYFAAVLLPGILVLCLLTALLAIFAPWRALLRLSRPAAIALGALIALAAWTALSALWSPAPDIAIMDGQRVFVYAIAFGLGVWLCNLLGPRMELAMLPVAAGAAFAGVAAVVAMLGDNPADVLEVDAALDFPLGYRNANAAFFAIAFFPAVGLAAQRRLSPRARAVALGTATLCLELAALSQSRASMPAMAVALIVFIVLSPARLRALSWLGLAVLPALVVAFPLTDLFSAVADSSLDGAVGEMHAAARVVAFTTAASVVLGALAVRYETRIPGLGSRGNGANATVLYALVGVIALATLAFVVAVGDPIEWMSDRATEFKQGGSPDLSEEASRFTFNAGSDRYDLWRVALDDLGDDPLFGDGAGGFQYTYLQKREVVEQNARDAHSVEFEHLAELGLVGFGLLACALIAAALAARRARTLGPLAANLGAVAMAAGAYWLVHASIDWFWPYPGVTAPVFMLLGAAAAPSVLAPPAARQRWRGWLVAAATVLALTAVPLLASELYVDDAYDVWSEDTERAYDDLSAAAALNPFTEVPHLTEGAIARQLGDRPRAIAAFREAIEVRPEEYWGHYSLARLHARTDRLLARNEARVALELNPHDPEVRALARRLGVIERR